jgi:hypothetical protein
MSHKHSHAPATKQNFDLNESVNQWGRGWKWIIWMGLALAVIAIVTYVMSFDDSLQPGTKTPPAPAQATL